jgi:hypothetical protein
VPVAHSRTASASIGHSPTRRTSEIDKAANVCQRFRIGLAEHDVILRAILAILAAFVVNVLVFSAGEYLFNAVFPPPSGIDLDDQAQMLAFVKSIPDTAFIGLVAGWAAGAFAAAGAAFWISGRRPWAAGVGAAINFFGVLITVATIAYPLWVTAIGLFMPLIAASTIPQFRLRRTA